MSAINLDNIDNFIKNLLLYIYNYNAESDENFLWNRILLYRKYMTLYIADIKKIRHTFYMQRKHDSDIEILTFIMTYLLELERTYRKESITFIDYIDGIGAFNDLREIDFIGNYHEVNFESTIDNPYLLKVLKNMMIPNLRCGVLDPIVEKPLGALEKEQTCRTIMEEHRL